jgi:hypothetical protein
VKKRRIRQRFRLEVCKCGTFAGSRIVRDGVFGGRMMPEPHFSAGRPLTAPSIETIRSPALHPDPRRVI